MGAYTTHLVLAGVYEGGDDLSWLNDSKHTSNLQIFAPITAPLSPPLLVDADTLYAPSVTVTLAPPLLVDADTLYAPTITIGPGALAPPLLVNANVLHAPVVIGGAHPKIDQRFLFRIRPR